MIGLPDIFPLTQGNAYSRKRRVLFDNEIERARDAPCVEHDQMLAKKISRRSAITLGALAGSYLLADETLQARRQAIELSVHSIDVPQAPHVLSSRELPARRSANVCITGFNVASADDLAHSLATPLGKFGDVVAVQLASEGLNPRATAARIQDYIENNSIEEINFHCQSMGAVTMAQTLEYMQDTFENVEFGRVVFDCCPSSWRDVRADKQQDLHKLYETATWQEQVKAKMGFTILDGPVSIAQGEFWSSDENLWRAARECFGNLDEEKCSSQLVRDQTISLFQFDARLLGEVLPQSTKLYYAFPANPIDDETINPDTAHIGLEKGIGRPIIKVPLYDTSHASSVYHRHSYANMYYRINDMEQTDYWRLINLPNPRSAGGI